MEQLTEQDKEIVDNILRIAENSDFKNTGHSRTFVYALENHIKTIKYNQKQKIRDFLNELD